MRFIIGTKQEMTQVWRGDKVVAVTAVKTEPCVVVQKKTEDKDGYLAVQVGFGQRHKKNIAKPQKGHMGKLGNFRYLREFRGVEDELRPGDRIELDNFGEGDKVQVTGVTKGRGFQGVVKRHGFHGSKKTHGNKDQLRMPGSIGATGPAHVFKGTKMGGRMGGDRQTLKNLEIVQVDTENNILYIKGAVPGARNSLLLISGDGELKVSKPEDKFSSAKASEDRIEEEAKTEKVKTEAVKDEISDKKEEEAKPEEPKTEETKAEETKPEETKAKEEKKDEKKEASA